MISIGKDSVTVLHLRTETQRSPKRNNRVLRRIFGRRRDEVTREWRKLHNEELHDLYSLPSILGWTSAGE
jgi:hypothetical protein